YFLPKAANRPVFSYRLSILHFWSLVFIYIWAGPHHLHYTALPEWASSLGMVFSLMLWMPSWGGMINGLLTLRGAWHKVTSDPVLKFFVVGITFYGMATFEGPMLSIKAVNSLSHYNDWGIAHVHSGALGWNGFMVFGMIYWLAPRLFQSKAFDVKLASLHFWLATIGILLYVISMYVAGLTQGLMWRAMTPEGQLAYPTFVETTTRIIPFYWIRVLGGLLYLGGTCVGAYHLYKMWKGRPEKYDEPVIEAAPLSKDFEREVAPVSTLDGVAPVALKIDVWRTMWWHRTWERMPIKFTILVIVAVSVASLFEIIPTFVIRSNVPTIASVRPYTPLELAGRDLYISEGCYNCHSQMIRPIISETKRYGEYSKPGESVYDHPFQWGSRRIGPDLARIGGVRSDSWHISHFYDPRGEVDQSIMPSYGWLLKKKIDYKSIPLRMKANRAVGVPYTDEQIATAIEDAETQAAEINARFLEEKQGPFVTYDGEELDLSDTQVIAMVAYLQRLGTDLAKTVPVEEAPEEDGVTPAETTETVAADADDQLSEAR
ncbi:MAG: cytochrome-c oxidase, cbb3-type subunit II, partial [Planctomycetota bacterium]